jgi:hypothetical protein
VFLNKELELCEARLEPAKFPKIPLMLAGRVYHKRDLWGDKTNLMTDCASRLAFAGLKPANCTGSQCLEYHHTTISSGGTFDLIANVAEFGV